MVYLWVNCAPPMDDFRTYFLGLTKPQRVELAGRAHSTAGVLQQVAYGHKNIELGFADVLVALGEGRYTLDGLPLTERAIRQRATREASVEWQRLHSCDACAVTGSEPERIEG